MKMRSPKTTKHKGATASGRRASSATNPQKQLDQRTRERDDARKHLSVAQRHLAEALEQQTATSEVLKIISRSAFDLQTVLDSLVENAVRLCSADKGLISRQDGELYRFAASYGHSPEFVEFAKRNPMRKDRTTATGRAILERRVVHIHDILADSEYRWIEDHPGQEEMHRTIMAIPMYRESAIIGVIGIRRNRIQPFTEKQIDLVTTFADQAVIAIENVRLFEEVGQKNGALTEANSQLTEALERQKTTTEILQVISSSPTELHAVFNTIAESAARLCRAKFCHVFRFDGRLIHFAASHGLTSEAIKVIRTGYPMTPGRMSLSARAILSGSVEEIPDIDTDPDYQHAAIARAMDYRSILAVPILNKGRPVGAIVIGRSATGSFPKRQIELVETFADQAVIAIENVRLFEDVQKRTAELTESLEQQTATSEVLQVISSSPGELEPVFEAMLANATRICEAKFANLALSKGTPYGWSRCMALRLHSKTCGCGATRNSNR